MVDKTLEQIRTAMDQRLKEKESILIAVDGRCASGKTTLAAGLRERAGCGVIHMDDFFLRPEQRTPERLARPGENVDWERFLAEVLLPLRQGGKVVYRPYDCRTQSMGDPITLERSAVVVVEGSYSCHPELWESYDLHVFLDVDPEEQLRRIRARNGAQGVQMFLDRWIPLEERYFQAFSIPQRCELRFPAAEPAGTACDKQKRLIWNGARRQ